MSSKLDEKQQLLGFFFSNLTLNAEKLDVELAEPFKMMAISQDQTIWRYLVDTFRNGQIQITISLSSIQSVLSEFVTKSIKSA